MIGRREFVTLLIGGAAAWPVAARAQQASTPVVGLLGSGWAESAAYTRAALRTGLSEAGYVENRNVMFEYRYAEAKFERLPQLAAELAQRGVSVIVATPRTELAAKSATAAIHWCAAGAEEARRHRRSECGDNRRVECRGPGYRCAHPRHFPRHRRRAVRHHRW